MVAIWHQVARNVDNIVDNVWSEPVVLIPWTTSEYGDGMPDPGRPKINSRGVYLGAQAGLQDTGGGGGGTATVTADVVLSIRKEPLERVGLKKGDRVTFLDRNEMCEVAWIGPEPSGRPRVHLMRLRHVPLITGLPPEATSLALTSSVNPSQVAQAVTFNVEVTSAGETPTGVVRFLVDDVVQAQNVNLDMDGKASWITTALTAGSHEIKAEYADNVGLFEASEAVLTQTVSALVPQIELWASANNQPAGTPITFFAEVTAGSALPDGTIAFIIDGVQVFSGPVMSSAEFDNGAKYGPDATLTAGSYSVVATFTSNELDKYTDVTSAPLTQTVL